VVLTAFVKFVQNAKAWYLKDSAVAAAMVKVSTRLPRDRRMHPSHETHRANTWLPRRSPSGKQSVRTQPTVRMR
jgi:hypothetical protein